VTLDVNGVGYEVHMPLSDLDALGKLGDTVHILTHLHIREHEHTLFGFRTAQERDLFRLLIHRVSGVGPKVAMAVLSGLAVEDFQGAVVRGDVTTISQIKGVGKKTAERMVLELKDKVGVAAAWEAARAPGETSELEAKQTDAVLALISLGYKQGEAARAVGKIAQEQGEGVSVEALVRSSLQHLQG